ncbi:Domain of uncharacterised function (DUF1837) [Serratia proteamaculans]|uniref:HamA C-terminal domain-containing protein n=1 Tax=Serratia proteamaculans TaxID=28151 RepID=UPI0021774D68|nr:DUF1837 domain-containing protein [Serratia proteamaculans]CAI0881373.1 Domain of uncharacterised function (DUF1837) [Serratia proteamaculans]
MDSFDELNNYVSVKKKDFESCINVVEHNLKIESIDANLRFHYIKFNGNGVPMIKNLAEKLYEYIIDYCIASKNRGGELTNQQFLRLTKQARSLFRHPDINDDVSDKTGEAGEALLFFLMEAVLGAPQLVAKMELKTNASDEVKGSDGIHIKWNDDDKIVEFFFGESKLYKNISAALSSAFKSIDEFHANEMYKHEFNIVTKHFKYANNEIRNAVTDLIISGEPGENVRINHACLIGYDWKGFSELKSTREIPLSESFLTAFRDDLPRIHGLINKKFESFSKKELKFDVFFIPFPSVSEFRNEFNRALD